MPWHVLSKDDIDYVFRTTQNLQKSVDDYRQRAHGLEEQGQQVDWLKIEENVQEFTRQTRPGLFSYLGEERFNKLQNNSFFASADK